MNKDMLDYWEFLKKSNAEYYKNQDEICPDEVYKKVEEILNECREVRNDWYSTKYNFRIENYYLSLQYGYGYDEKQLDIRDDIDMHFDGPHILYLIYVLTRIDYTYIYANHTVADILKELNGNEYQVEGIDELKLYKLLKEEEDQQISGIKEVINISEKHSGIEKPLTLEAVFSKEFQYKFIMKILVEKKLIQPISFIWIDRKSGYKSYISALLQCLYLQNYYNTILTHEQSIEIAKNTFKIDIALSTIAHVKNYGDFKIDFIPLASTLNDAPNTPIA